MNFDPPVDDLIFFVKFVYKIIKGHLQIRVHVCYAIVYK